MPLAYSYIRFSTTEQSKGDSFRRQFEQSKRYAEERNLVLDENLSMMDLGISAFSGDNLERGALGTFLNAVNKGLVPTGSFLLIESLDRLSRENVMAALTLFMNIVAKGITIVTISDKREYSKESIEANYTELIVSIAVMARAHEESMMKSHRISKAWEQKRIDALTTGKVMTKVTPFWLKAKDDRTGYVFDEKGAADVRRVFELSADGFGVHRIAAILNKEGVTTIKGRKWLPSNLGKLLRNRAVIGEATFNSFKNVDGKRLPVEPIIDYYPPVIDEATFYKVNDAILDRNNVGKGRSSESRNLFRGLLKCGECGSSMPVYSNVFRNGDKKRATVNLQCSGVRIHKSDCKAVTWGYYDFQYQFFKFIREVDLSSIVDAQEDTAKAKLIDDLVADNRSKHDKAKTKLARFMRLISESDDVPKSILQSIIDIEKEIADIELAGSVIANQYQAFQAGRRALGANQDTLKSLIAMLNDPVIEGTMDYSEYTEKEIVLRYRLAQQIRSLVKSITVHTAPWTLEGMTEPVSRGFTVTFNNGYTRVVKPDSNFTMKLNLKKEK